MSVPLPPRAFASIVSNAKQRDPVAFFKRSETELVSLTHFCLRVLLPLRPCICFNVCLIMHNCDSACLHATWSVCKSRSLLFFNEGMHRCREQVNHLKALCFQRQTTKPAASPPIALIFFSFAPLFLRLSFDHTCVYWSPPSYRVHTQMCKVGSVGVFVQYTQV